MVPSQRKLFFTVLLGRLIRVADSAARNRIAFCEHDASREISTTLMPGGPIRIEQA
jgi:hypothetical protein